MANNKSGSSAGSPGTTHTVHHVVHRAGTPPAVPPVPPDVPPQQPPQPPQEAAQPPVVGGGIQTPTAAPPVVTPFTAPVGVYPAPPATGVHAFAITPSDATALPRRTRVIYVGGAGNVAVIASGDDPAGAAVVFNAVPVGTQIQLDASYVKATGTTATLLVGIG